MPAPKLDDSEINKIVRLIEEDSKKQSATQPDREENLLMASKLIQIRDWRKRHPKTN